MTEPALIERITRSLAFMLRHQPETFDLELDPHGFADLDDVVQALNERLGEPVEEEDVREAVSAGDRPRYEIQGDRIRALYGHSIPVEPGPSSKPPEYLFVAVPEQELERARRFGLRGGRRRFLHLAITREDAAESGRRASRDYTVLVIHALDAWEEGISFYDRTALWLAEEVPTHLIEVEGTYHDGTDPLPRRYDSPREQGASERERGPDRHGRGRGRRGRGRERYHERGGADRGGPERASSERSGPDRGSMDRGGADRGGADRGDVGRGAVREPERFQTSSPSGDARARRPSEGFERESRRDGQRPPREARESSGQPAFSRERQGRGEGRGNGRRDERRPPEARPERQDERPAEAPAPHPSVREPRRERASEGAARPPADPPRGGFGAGLDSQEERRREREAREERPPPRPTAPPPREERPPVENDRPGSGAGL